MEFSTGDMVNLPIFGKWLVVESYWSKVIINFENKIFWLKTVSKDLFDADKKRLTKKKDIKTDPREDYYNEIQRDDALVSNDML